MAHLHGLHQQHRLPKVGPTSAQGLQRRSGILRFLRPTTFGRIGFVLAGEVGGDPGLQRLALLLQLRRPLEVQFGNIVAFSTRVMASLSPSWASEITSFTPFSPRRTKFFRKLDQNGVTPDGTRFA